MKKIVVVMLTCCLLVLSSFSIGYAAESFDDSELFYVVERVGQILSKNGYSATDEITVSNALELTNLDTDKTSNIYFVFDGDEIIGHILVDVIDGAFTSSFEFKKYLEIQNAFELELPITLFNDDGCLFASVDSNLYVLQNINNVDVSNYLSQLDADDGVLLQRETKISVPVRHRSTYYHLLVPPVENTTSPQGRGLCWAACIASKFMYQSGNTGMTALSVFYDCWDSVGRSESNIPLGNDTWYRNASSVYGIPITIVSGLMSEYNTCNKLANGKPIVLGLGNHAVVLCGVDEYQYYWEFIIMDPNNSSYVYISQPTTIFTNPSQFNYVTTYGQTYTAILKSRY